MKKTILIIVGTANMSNIPSSVFVHSYCIFISRKHLPAYKDYIVKNKLFNKGIGILKKTDNEEVCAIIIPLHEEYKKIEKDLFSINKGEDGFWGQFGLGYKESTWKAI
jgi:hypothetical protein